jgi:hypothetical protein
MGHSLPYERVGPGRMILAKTGDSWFHETCFFMFCYRFGQKQG